MWNLQRKMHNLTPIRGKCLAVVAVPLYQYVCQFEITLRFAFIVDL